MFVNTNRTAQQQQQQRQRRRNDNDNRNKRTSTEATTTTTTTTMMMMMMKTNNFRNKKNARARAGLENDNNNSDTNETKAEKTSDGKFKRAPGEDEMKFTKSATESPFSRKRIQPLPSKFGVDGVKAQGAKQNLPFNQTTNREGSEQQREEEETNNDEKKKKKEESSASFAAQAAARSPFDNVTPPTKPSSPFAQSSSNSNGSSSSASSAVSPFAKVTKISSASDLSSSPLLKPSSSSVLAAKPKVKNPFNEPDAATYGAKPMKVDKPKEMKFEIPKFSFNQVFIVFSFITIIGLMVGTFLVVLNAGGIKFNDQ